MRKTPINTITYPNESFLFFTNLRKHFIKRGEGERLDRYFRTNLLNRLISKRKDMYGLLANAMLASTPFIRLKAKKRRKYTIYKVHIPTREWSRRKGVGSFAKSVKEHLSKDLFASIEKQLLLVKTGKSNVEQKRNEYHKLSLKVTPYRWKKIVYNQRREAWKAEKAKLRELERQTKLKTKEANEANRAKRAPQPKQVERTTNSIPKKAYKERDSKSKRQSLT